VYLNWSVATGTGTLIYNGTENEVLVWAGVDDSIAIIAANRLGSSSSSVSFASQALADTNDSSGQPFAGTGLIITLAGTVLFLLIILFVVYRVRNRGHRMKYRPPSSDDWEFPRDQLITMELIGKGSFGEVFRGAATWTASEATGGRGRTIAVAVKKVARRYLTEQDHNDFRSEMHVLKMLSTPGHEHIVRLLGVCTRREPVLILTQLMSRGSLKQYLQSFAAEFNDSTHKIAPSSPFNSKRASQVSYREGLPMADKLKFCLHIAKGLQHLAEKDVIHRDLSARNCYLDEHLNIKIGDFGLSIMAHHHQVLDNRSIPVRWSSPEALLSQQVRSSSDMWSFGVVVWEILTLGSLPYGDMTHQQIIINVCSGRTRLSTPVNTPLGLHRLLHRCWGLNPLERPSCEELVTVFTELHEAFASTDGPRPIILTTKQDSSLKQFTYLDDRFLIIGD